MSDILKVEPDHDSVANMPEVEFALVLSRIINSMKEDPAQLRQSVYELARLKLRRDLLRGDPQEANRIKRALETAIVGVENFSQKQDAEQPRLYVSNSAIGSTSSNRSPLAQLDYSSQYADYSDVSETYSEATTLDETPARASARRAKEGSLTWPKIRFGIGVGIVILILCGAALKYSGAWTGIGGKITKKVALSTPVQPSAPAAPAVVPTPAAVEPPGLNFPLPTVYGTYVVNNGQLSELEVLPGQVPDRRIAMSSLIDTPSHTIVPDGLPTFVLFRRDLASLGADRIEARAVARIARTLKFGANNKPTAVPEENLWTIRNTAYQFRLAPVPGHPEMLVLHPEGPDPLPAGRYVLSLKRQPYDFTVAGAITDPNQCMERTEAANGLFYSACKQP